VVTTGPFKKNEDYLSGLIKRKRRTQASAPFIHWVVTQYPPEPAVLLQMLATSRVAQ